MKIRRRTTKCLAGIAAAFAVVAVQVQSAWATTDYAWTGGSSSTSYSPNWNVAANWGGTLPTAPIGTLLFDSAHGGCTNAITCQTFDNIGPLTATNLNFVTPP